MNAHTIDTILDLHAALESQLGSFRSFVPGRTGGLLYRREREREMGGCLFAETGLKT